MATDEEMVQELKEIRKLLTPAPAPPARKGFVGEFLDFVGKYKVLGLAVAFILGVYLGALVKALVDGFVMPLVGLVLPGGGWQNWTLWVFSPGIFISALITFIIVCLVVFILVKLATKMKID